MIAINKIGNECTRASVLTDKYVQIEIEMTYVLFQKFNAFLLSVIN